MNKFFDFLAHIDVNIVSTIADLTLAGAATFISIIIFRSQRKRDKIASFEAYTNASNTILLSILSCQRTEDAFRAALYENSFDEDMNFRSYIASLSILNYLDHALLAAKEKGLDQEHMELMTKVILSELLKSSEGRRAIDRGTYSSNLLSAVDHAKSIEDGDSVK